MKLDNVYWYVLKYVEKKRLLRFFILKNLS